MRARAWPPAVGRLQLRVKTFDLMGEPERHMKDTKNRQLSASVQRKNLVEAVSKENRWEKVSLFQVGV